MENLKTYALLVSVCALMILSKGRIDFASPAFAGWDLHSYRVMAIAALAPVDAQLALGANHRIYAGARNPVTGRRKNLQSSFPA